MSDIGVSRPGPSRPKPGWRTRLNRLAASRRFQSWAARFPLTRRITRREGEDIFDLVAGFVHSQCLAALVDLKILDRLLDRPKTVAQLAHETSVPEDRLRVLLRAGAALNLLQINGNTVDLTRRGAALSAVPGLADMIGHHAVLYRDLAEPTAFFRGEAETELANFWPYVFGAGAADDPATAARYSRLMAESQTLVAEETLTAVSFAKSRHLMDVGGGIGAFLTAALSATPGLTGTLFDLPAVVATAADRFARAGLSDRVTIVPGSFRDDPVPLGADTISLVRVLYDHADETVQALLRTACAALPPGGRIVISEPMLGTPKPSRAGDAYFAIYTLAMGTGRTRSAAEISELLKSSGFTGVQPRSTNRPFITSVVEGVKPA